MWSYRRKVVIFTASVAFLFIMVYYYYRHFIHCDAFAFSKFATAEYFVAVTNMAFYWTLTTDLPSEEIMVLRGGGEGQSGSQLSRDCLTSAGPVSPSDGS